MRALSALLAIAVVTGPRLASGADYYVAPNGSDSNDGSPAAPWATLQYAADQVAAGDTVHVANGDYTGFELTTGGTEASPIRFIADGDAARIVADAPTRPDGINVEGADHVVIDGFVTNGRTRAGVRCALSSNVTIRRIRADGNGVWGIFTGCCPNVIIEDNVTTGSVDEHGIYHSNSADDPIIRRNVIYGNNANGIHMNGDASITCDNIASDGLISNAVVERNVIYDNGVAGGSGINGDGVTNSVIRNNLLYLARSSGISLYRIDAGGPATGNTIVNNTVVVSDVGRWALNITDGSTGNTVLNNILLTYHPFRGSIVVAADSLMGFTSDHNVLTARLSADGDTTILDLAGWQALGYDVNSVASDPAAVFADAAGDDYRLRDGSPAVDSADPATATSEDIEGNARPAGSGPDVGAYELGAAAADAGAGLPEAGTAAGGVTGAAGSGGMTGAAGSGNASGGTGASVAGFGGSGNEAIGGSSDDGGGGSGATRSAPTDRAIANDRGCGCRAARSAGGDRVVVLFALVGVISAVRRGRSRVAVGERSDHNPRPCGRVMGMGIHPGRR